MTKAVRHSILEEMKFIARILLTALGLLLAAKLIPGVDVFGLYPAIIAALVLGILNALVKPILIVLTLPITVITLGLFIFVINGMLFWFAASFLEDFSVSGIGAAIVGSLVVSLVSAVGNWFLK